MKSVNFFTLYYRNARTYFLPNQPNNALYSKTLNRYLIWDPTIQNPSSSDAWTWIILNDSIKFWQNYLCRVPSLTLEKPRIEDLLSIVHYYVLTDLLCANLQSLVLHVWAKVPKDINIHIVYSMQSAVKLFKNLR